MSLRREVYLPAARSLSQAHHLLTALSNVDLADESINKELAVSLETISAVHVIGRDDTVRALMDYMNSLMKSFAELYPIRLRLRMRKNDIDFLTGLINKAAGAQDQNLEMMKQYNLEAKPDSARWTVLENYFKHTQDTHAQHANEQKLLLDEQMREVIEFAELCMLRSVQVSNLIPPALFAVRDELELPIDKERYLELHEASASDALAALQNALQKIKRTDVELDK